jgi:hypothetical protein
MYSIRNSLYLSDEEPESDTEPDTTESDTTESDTTESETDSEYEYEIYEQEMEHIYDTIYFDDSEYLDNDKEDEHYYLGLYEYIRRNSELLIGTTVSPRIFYKYPYNNVSRYLRAYSIVRNKYSTKNIQIMQLKIITTHLTTYTHNTLTVIIKTYWIRLIQRHWKKIYKIRMESIKLRKNISNQRHFELNGRYKIGSNNLPPSLYGMLSMYNYKAVDVISCL